MLVFHNVVIMVDIHLVNYLKTIIMVLYFWQLEQITTFKMRKICFGFSLFFLRFLLKMFSIIYFPNRPTHTINCSFACLEDIYCIF